uniref:Uncharacterized protein n=1 Tax=Desulfacinum infernum TaxID=35837 RepID=A0A832EI87_9BACT
MTLVMTAGLVACVNLPFGYWRARARRFSRTWFLAVHLPVPFVVALRLVSGLGWRLSTFPVLMAAFCAGQFLGGAVYHAVRRFRVD